jgi:hypothetical protein
MARKRTKAGPKLIEPPKHHAHIGRDAKGRLCGLVTRPTDRCRPGAASLPPR